MGTIGKIVMLIIVIYYYSGKVLMIIAESSPSITIKWHIYFTVTINVKCTVKKIYI